MTPIQVCIADDHALLRRGLRVLLEADARIQVSGEAATADEAIDLVAQLQPNVLLFDLSMPGVPFEESLGKLRREWPDTRVIVLTMHDDMEYAKAALLAGAAAYVTKDMADSELIATIISVYEGRTVVNLRADSRTHQLPQPKHLARKPASISRVDSLSERENEVIQLVAQGFTNAQISDKLFLSVKTIETYRWRLMKKLGLNSRAELVEYVTALQRGSETAS